MNDEPGVEKAGILDAHYLDMKVTTDGLQHVDQIVRMIALECDFGQ